MIYAESRFDPTAVSQQGAVGLMQVLPETAAQIARETGGVAFVPADLEDPRVNIRYGTYYLRTVLDQFHGDRIAAIAAYNAGAGAVGEWEAAARAAGHPLRISDIPYAETRAYVRSVLEARSDLPADLRRPAAARLVTAAATHCERVFVLVESRG